MIRRMEEQELSSCLMIIRQSFATVTKDFGLASENGPTNGASMPLAHLEREHRKGKLMEVYAAGDEWVGFMQQQKKRMACTNGKNWRFCRSIGTGAIACS